jgi:hypothetical protein
MKKIRYTIYINNNVLYLLDTKTNKIYHQTFESLKYNEIIDYQKFNYELSVFIKNNHIKIPIFGYHINFIKNNLSNLQIAIYQKILINFFKSITFIELKTLYEPTKNQALANITKDYIDYYYQKEMLRIEKKIFNNNELEIINYLINNIYKPRKIIITGNDKNIHKICNDLNEKLKIHCYYNENYETFTIDLLKKAHK